MVTNYQRGYQLEREVVNYFKERGYTSERTAGSHSVFDVIATKEDTTILVQCKRVKGKYFSFRKEIKELRALETDCEKWFIIKLDRMKGRKSKLIVKKL